MLNIVLSHRDIVDTSALSYEEHKTMIKNLFEDFNPM
jgi:hypothetical protein